MSDAAPEPNDALQFTTAEPAAVRKADAPSVACAACQRPIADVYYALAEKVLCPACCARVAAPPTGTKVGRLTKASIFGIAAGLAGAAIWFAIRRIAHLEIGLVAILVGFMVGKAVRSGSGGAGGRGYQVLAVLITYCCIAANYMPDIFETLWASRDPDRVAAVEAAQAPGQPPAGDPTVLAPPREGDNVEKPVEIAMEPERKSGVLRTAVALVVVSVLVFGFALAMPFLAGAENIIGLLIIAFALWEAWKFNARRGLPLSGPYQVGAPPAA